MSKKRPSYGLFPCPNPCCSSNVVFRNEANLNKHFGAKPGCYAYALSSVTRSQHKAILLAQQKTMMAAELLPSELEEDNALPNTETTIHMDDDEECGFNHLEDYEECGFNTHKDDELDVPGYHTTFTKNQATEIYLLKLCTEMEAPLYAFEEIMKWARQAYHDGYDFVPQQSTYHSQIDQLEVWMGMQNQRPEEVCVTLPGKECNDIIKVTRFDFKTQMRSLLDDPVLNRDENLVINENDRFQRYIPPDGRLGECLSGSWYNHAWDEMEKDGHSNFMIPIILYIDKTELSTSGKLSIHPVQMSLGIFTEKVRKLI